MLLVGSDVILLTGYLLAQCRFIDLLSLDISTPTGLSPDILLLRDITCSLTGYTRTLHYPNSYRDPVVINVSYFFQYRDDVRRAKQTRRAASLITGALEFRDAVVQ